MDRLFATFALEPNSAACSFGAAVIARSSESVGIGAECPSNVELLVCGCGSGPFAS